MEMSFVTIKARIAEDQSDERRTIPRRPVEIEGTMRELGASGVEARVLNISERGFMAVSEAQFEVGSRVWLILPGRERANAVVKWIAGDKLGAEFAAPVSLEEFGGQPLTGVKPAFGDALKLNRSLQPPTRSLVGRAERKVCHADHFRRFLEAL